MNQNVANVGFIGFGKRVRSFYIQLLSLLKNDFKLVGFTKKTRNNVDEIKAKYKINFFENTPSLLKASPDLIIVSTPHTETLNILNSLNGFSGVVIIDTPVIFNPNGFNFKIIALEQWPFLPIEQFKKQIINSNILGNLVYAENDSRTFQYHGIAQLRSYFGKQKTISQITGSPPIVGGEDCWNIGSVRHSDGTGFLYKFSYFSKKAPFRPQGLKLYFTEGSIISGCLSEKGNDYEILKILFKDKKIDAEVFRSNKEILNKETSYHSGNDHYEINSIRCQIDSKNIEWKNPFVGTAFNDQEIAVATIFLNAKNFILNQEEILFSASMGWEDFSISQIINNG